MEVMVWCSLVSSAYREGLVSFSINSGRSLMKIMKSKGPRMLPSGTPEVTGDQLDVAPSTTTLWVLPFK